MFKGVFTPAITVFNDDGSLDWKGNEDVLHHLVDQGMNGVLILGSIGEFFSLSVSEKKQYISFAIKAVDGKIPVLVGTGHTNVDEVIEITSFAEKEGAAAAVVVSPYYLKLEEDSLYQYYADIAQSTKMPIMLYNFPDRTAISLSPELVLRLATDFQNIVGIKDSIDSMSHTRKLISLVKEKRKDFCIFSGFDEYLILNLMAGGDGTIGGLSNVAPKLFVDLFNAYNAKDFDLVYSLQNKVNTLMDIYDVSQPFVSSIKGAAAIMGRKIGYSMRKPSITLESSQLEKIRTILKKADMI